MKVNALVVPMFSSLYKIMFFVTHFCYIKIPKCVAKCNPWHSLRHKNLSRCRYHKILQHFWKMCHKIYDAKQKTLQTSLQFMSSVRQYLQNLQFVLQQYVRLVLQHILCVAIMWDFLWQALGWYIDYSKLCRKFIVHEILNCNTKLWLFATIFRTFLARMF